MGRLVRAANAAVDAQGRPGADLYFAYDDAGNLTAQTGTGAGGSAAVGIYRYPAANGPAPDHAPFAIGARAMAYDSNGNLVSDGERSFGWDGSNRPVRVVRGLLDVRLGYGASA